MTPPRIATPPRIVMVGSSMVDLIAYVPRLPAPGETLAGSDFRQGHGGKGSNQAVMAARLGAGVAVVVCLGDDAFGPGTRQNYLDHGIDAAHVHLIRGVPSGVAPICVDVNTGQNSIVVVPGANARLDAAKVRAAADLIGDADAVLCQLETPLEATVEAFGIARDRGTMTILNPAPAAPMPDGLHGLLRLTDVLIPNETEAAALTGLPIDSDGRAATAAARLREMGPKTVVLTLGGRGACVLAGGRGGRAEFVAAERVEAVDTTGAGDAFVGAFAFFHAGGRDAAESARRACRVATRSVLRPGTQSSFPTRDELADVLAS